MLGVATSASWSCHRCHSTSMPANSHNVMLLAKLKLLGPGTGQGQEEDRTGQDGTGWDRAGRHKTGQDRTEVRQERVCQTGDGERGERTERGHGD